MTKHLFIKHIPAVRATRSTSRRKARAFGLLFNRHALWVGAHYSSHAGRWCINLIPCLTIWFTEPGGKTP